MTVPNCIGTASGDGTDAFEEINGGLFECIDGTIGDIGVTQGVL